MYSITLQTTDNIITSGDRIGQIQFAASNESDGSAAISVAGSVFCQAEGSYQSASNPTSLVLATAAADASAAVGRIKVTDNGNILPMSDNSYDLGNSNLQFKNQYISEGVVLSSNTPSSTTNKLYNEGGTLKFNGSAISGGGGGISNVVEDTTPQLGGDLDAQTNTITFTNGNVLLGDSNTETRDAATYNVMIGGDAGTSALGNYNIGIGYQAVGISVAGNNDDYNIGIGYQAAGSIDGDFNVSVGYQAGLNAGGFYAGSQRRPQKNVFLGFEAGKGALGNNNIEITNYNAGDSRLADANYNDYLNIGHTIFADMSNRRVNIGLIGSLSSWAVNTEAALLVRPTATTDIGVLVEGISSHSASLQEWQNSSSTKLVAIGPDGGVELPDNVPSTTTNKLYNDGGTLTFNGSAVGGGGETNEFSFKTISVAGQSDVVADTTTDTLTLAAGSNVTITTNASTDTITIAATDTNTQLSTEEVQDIAGPLVATGGTKTLITVTYDDANGNMDFVVDNNLANYDNTSAGFLTAHPNISAASSSDNSGRTYIQDIILDSNGHVTGITTATETVTDTNTTYSAGTNISLAGTTFNVDDAFLVNNADDTTTGTITMANLIIGNAGNIGSASDTDAIAIASDGEVTFSQRSTFSKAVKTPLQSNTDGTTVTFNLNEANTHTVTLGGNRTLAISNETAGQKFIINLVQDGTGSRTVTWFSTIKWAGGSAPTLTSTANKADSFGFLCTGTDAYYGFVIGQNI